MDMIFPKLTAPAPLSLHLGMILIYCEGQDAKTPAVKLL